MSMEVVLQGKPTLKAKVKVSNCITDDSITMDKFSFLSAYAVLKDEVNNLQQAVLNQREYEVEDVNDPVQLLMDNTVEMGIATSFNMGLAYNIGTDQGEVPHEIKSLTPPFENIGILKVKWTPLANEDDLTGDLVDDIDDPCVFIGKPWTARLEIEAAVSLPLKCELSYVSYEFNGATYTTDTVEGGTRSPVYNYSVVHHNPKCDATFVDSLENGSTRFTISVNPLVQPTGKPPISQANEVINRNMVAMTENKKATAGGTYASVTITRQGPLQPLSDKDAEEQYMKRIKELEDKLEASEKACTSLQSRVAELEIEVAAGGGRDATIQLENEARCIFNMMDSNKDGTLSPAELSYQLSDLGFPENEIEKLFLRMDVNGNGKIELQEFEKSFVEYTKKLQKYTRQ